MRIGAVDLFCGVGGLTFGLKKAGIAVAAGIDLDATCRYAYERNNGSLFINKDIAEVSGSEIRTALQGNDLKILAGCAPCQPFSSHRKDKRDRKNHKDWSLLYQFARLVEETEPDAVTMENVPALTSELVFIDFVASLERLKYFVSYSIVNVADYGVPQRRKRLILLASRNGPIDLLPPTHADTRTTVRSAIGQLPSVGAGEEYAGDRLHYAPALSQLNLRRIRASRPNGTWRDWPDELVLDCHRRDSGRSYPSVYGRMAWDDVSPTITTQFTCYGTGRFGHPDQDRAITLREGALLQSFPIGYSFLCDEEQVSHKKVARHIGNAVPPRLAEVVGRSIVMSFKDTDDAGRWS